MEENFYVVIFLCALVILKHYLRRRFDIKTKQNDRDPATNIVNASSQKEIVEGCKSMHFNTKCKIK